MHRINLSGHWMDGTRFFGAPRSEGQGLWLAGMSNRDTQLILNDELLGMIEAGVPFRIAVTSRLRPRNRLCCEPLAQLTLHLEIEEEQPEN